MISQISLDAVLWSCLGFFALSICGLISFICIRHLKQSDEFKKEQTQAMQKMTINMVSELKDRPTWPDVQQKCEEVASARINQHVIDEHK